MNLAFLTLAATLSAGPATADDARREARTRFGYAAWLAARELPAQALRQLEAAAKLDPDSLEVARDRLRLYALFGRHADATRTAKAILGRDPDDVATAQTLAQIAHEGNNDAEAVRVLRAVLARPVLAKPSLRRFGVLRDLATVATNDPAAREVALRGQVEMMAADAGLLTGSPFFGTPAELAAALPARREQLADALVAQKKFAEAEAVYRAVGGSARQAWNLSGLAQAREKYAEGLALLTSVAPPDGREAEYYDRLAELTRRAGPGGDAVRLLKTAAEARPRSSPVWWVYAEELGRQDPGAAARLFGELAETTSDPKFWDRFVRFHRAAGQFRDLLDAADTLARKVAPQDADEKPVAVADEAAHADTLARYRALVQAMKADAALPTALAREGAANFAGRHPLTRDLVVWFAERGDRLEVFDAALAAAARTGDDRAAQLYFDSLARQRRWQACLDLCDEMDAGPRRGGRGPRGDRRTNWAFFRAQPLVELGRGPEALRALDAAERAAASPLSVQLAKARILTQIDRPRDALAMIDKVLRQSPDADTLRSAKLRQAEAHLALREFPAADALYDDLLDGEETAGVPEVLVLNNYAYNLADQGRKLPEAEAMLRRAVDLDRDDARRAGRPDAARGTYLDSLGWVLFRRGKLAEARDVFAQAAATLDGAGDPTVWDHAGDVHARLGDPAAARAAWATALKLSENTHQGRQHGRRDEIKVKLGQLP